MSQNVSLGTNVSNVALGTLRIGWRGKAAPGLIRKSSIWTLGDLLLVKGVVGQADHNRNALIRLEGYDQPSFFDRLTDLLTGFEDVFAITIGGIRRRSAAIFNW